MVKIELFAGSEIEMKQDKKRMMKNKSFHQHFILVVGAILISYFLVGCGSSVSPDELTTGNYTPLSVGDWNISTPVEQGLDPTHVAELYYNAAELETLYGLLVVKNGYLVAEDYFNAGSVSQIGNRQSVTKSYISALVGIALEQGYPSSVDQKMLDFFAVW